MIKGKLTILREKRIEDAPTDYQWRIDEELSALDATTPMRMSYASFLRMTEDELRYPATWSKRFAVETHDGKLIGNCMYYDIDTVKGQTELGIMIGDKEYWNRGYGTDVVKTLTGHIFSTTSFGRIYLHTLAWNVRAQKSFQKCGFVPVKNERRSGYDFILMELVRDRWEEMKDGATPLEDADKGEQG
ncbi:MAG: GNAT family N-acetyltransferase [Chloroflexi bacterium]|nr:GNAT family N-acetyltransferase [Chloroflexota bacterium]